jgi:DNA repair protein RecN (Recombination protein N)
MLTHLDIRNYAIIEHIELELGPGMTVLTGETGAGKSILGDALSLVLGERGSGNLVRVGEEKAEIVAEFDVRRLPQVQDWLVAQDLDPTDFTCILRRSIGADGRSRAFLNGRPVPVQSLRELGEILVDIHGQHVHQSLLRRDSQRELLDGYAGHGPILDELAHLHRRWQQIAREMQALGGPQAEREAQAELLRYQVQELHALALADGEVAALDEEHGRLANAGRLLEGVQRSAYRLDGEEAGGAQVLLQDARREVEELVGYDGSLHGVLELLETAVIHAQEAAAELRRYADSVDLDPERLQWVEGRIDAVHRLARKHRVPPTELPDHLARLEAELSDLERREERLQALKAERDSVLARYRERAGVLHGSRDRAAQALAGSVTNNMQELGMRGGQFAIRVQAPPDAPPSPKGTDEVEFLVAANPGQPLLPLSQVASGGELSRISLAIQVTGARGSGVPTLVFDEVDVGIGGRVAEIVGQQLRRLGETRQVLCITHLPQVASQGAHHLQVRKHTQDDNTVTHIDALLGEGRVEEIARMLGGVEITRQTLAHAKEMIDRAQAGG